MQNRTSCGSEAVSYPGPNKWLWFLHYRLVDVSHPKMNQLMTFTKILVNRDVIHREPSSSQQCPPWRQPKGSRHNRLWRHPRQCSCRRSWGLFHRLCSGRNATQLAGRIWASLRADPVVDEREITNRVCWGCVDRAVGVGRWSAGCEAAERSKRGHSFAGILGSKLQNIAT